MPLKTVAVIDSPTAEILGATKREKAHLIVMGVHGQGLLSGGADRQCGPACGRRERDSGVAGQANRKPTICFAACSHMGRY
jgi:hypothetical protein